MDDEGAAEKRDSQCAGLNINTPPAHGFHNIANTYEKTKATNTFRFTDLPGEIRNKIYTILLCSFEHQETDATSPALHKGSGEITKLRNNISPQILRTSRTISNEACYVMRRKNLFVEVTFDLQYADLMGLIITKRFPVLHVTSRVKGFVITHDIVTQNLTPTKQPKLVRVIFLFRDLPCFCSILYDLKC